MEDVNVLANIGTIKCILTWPDERRAVTKLAAVPVEGSLLATENVAEQKLDVYVVDAVMMTFAAVSDDQFEEIVDRTDFLSFVHVHLREPTKAQQESIQFHLN